MNFSSIGGGGMSAYVSALLAKVSSEKQSADGSTATGEAHAELPNRWPLPIAVHQCPTRRSRSR